MTGILRRLARSRVLYALGLVVIGAALIVRAMFAPGPQCFTWYLSGLTLGFGFCWWLTLWSGEA